MKLIPEKYDDKTNKIRPGSVFVGSRTDNLKYIDKDGAEAELVPVSRYFASTEILRGQPVSIAQLADLGDEEAKNEFAYVKVTDPDVDESCLGLALNYAEPGQIVQIQRYGKFSFLTKESAKYKAQNAEGKLKEVFVDASEGFLFKEVRGQKLYINKMGSDDFDTGHDKKTKEHFAITYIEGESADDTEKRMHPNVTAKDTSSAITYDFIDSVYTAKNTIQIGQLTDAPTTVENDEDQVVTIELDITGDTRGPLDHTQFILTLGEDISFEEGNPSATLTEPYNDEGIYNEVKAVALATCDPEKAFFSIVPRTLRPATVGNAFSFIGVRKLGGGSVIIPFSDGLTFDKLVDAQSGATDIGYFKLLKSKYNSDQSDPIMLSPITFGKGNDYTEAIKDKLVAALKELDSEVFAKPVITESNKILDEDTSVKEYQIEASIAKGYFDVYQSEDLVKYFNLKTLRHGSEAPAGTAILADIRDAHRTNVIGVVVSNQPGTHHKGETIKVMRAGRFLTKGKLLMGAEYFLGLNGRITTRNQYWYDTCVKIGTVENDTNLIVNVQEMQHDFSGNIPITYMKGCKGGVAEKGFVLCDGVTYYNKEVYHYLYNALHDFYSEEELQCYVKNADGTLTDEIDDAHFVIPKVTMDDGTTVCQIKYTPSGLYHNLPRAPFLRFSGKIAEDKNDGSCKVETRDITRLVHYGTLEQSRIAPTLENIEVRLFVREPDNQLFPTNEGYADKYIWREMTPGFHVYNNDTVYGFDWVVKQNDYEGTDGVYSLEINTNQGLGICKISAQGQPIPLKNAEYKLIVTGKNLWTREYSLLENSDVADSMELNTDDLAPSVNAIKKYYEELVRTLRLEVANGQLVSDKDGTNIKKLHAEEFTTDEGTVVYEEKQLKKHIDQTATDKNEKGELIGVHGIINAGVEGNVDAASIGGAKVGDGADNITENFKPEDKAYIPFVKPLSKGDNFNTEMHGATVNTGIDGNGNELFEKSVKFTKDNEVTDLTKIANSKAKSIVKETTVGEINLKEKISSKVDSDTKEAYTEIDISEGTTPVRVTGIDELHIKDKLVVGNTTIPSEFIETSGGSSSSIAFKTVKNEKIDPVVKAKAGTLIKPNTSIDANGNKVSALDTSTMATEMQHSYQDASNTVAKLGSALQALYEMPLSVFEYNYGANKYKEQLGILVERVNQIRDLLKEGKAENIQAFAHKKNTMVKTDVSTITNAGTGADTLYNGVSGVDSARSSYNAYTYTKEEAQSIAAYLDFATNKQELAQEIRSTVTILLAAAQETQERLLNVETSIFGFDAPTVPGQDEEAKKAINALIETEELQQAINGSPLLLGLNRLMRALCLEIYNTTDLEKITKETESVLADSDTLKDKTTVATRIDEVDKIMSDLMYRINGLTRLEKYSDANIETHNYEKLTNALVENTTDEKTEHLEITAADNHSRAGQVDESGTWATLPSKDDYANKTEFAVSSKVPHSPNKDECGIVQIPETEIVKVVTREGGKDHTYEIEKPKYDKATGLPIYNEQGVAFLDAKVERINQKLSAVTETIYGEDSVLAKYPNRTEVLRRNITNLIDDLYPNRDFEIEVLDTSNLYKPFEESADIKTGKKDTSGVILKDGMNDGGVQHESIITPIVNTLYNFTSTQNYFGTIPVAQDKPFNGTTNAPAAKPESLKEVLWDATKLTPVSMEKATSQIDWIKSTIGITDTLSAYLFNNVFANLTTVKATEKASVNTTYGNLFSQESAFKTFTYNGSVTSWNELPATPVEEIAKATNVGSMLSRKNKTLESRILNLESAMDDFANFTAYVNAFTTENTKPMAEHNNNNSRYEEVPFTENLQKLVNTMAYRYNEMFLFPDDMAQRCFAWGETAVNKKSIVEHNKSIINEIDKLYKVTGSTTSIAGSNYDLTIAKTVNNTDIAGTLGSAIHVVYVKDAPKALDKDTIYLKISGQEVKADWTYDNGSVENVGDINIKSDYSHRVIMETMKAVAKNAAQAAFDYAYPVTAVKVERRSSSDNNLTSPLFGDNPYGIDPGKWELLESALVGSTSDTSVADSRIKVALPSELVLKGDLKGNAAYTYERTKTDTVPAPIQSSYYYSGTQQVGIYVGKLDEATVDKITNIESDVHTATITAPYTERSTGSEYTTITKHTVGIATKTYKNGYTAWVDTDEEFKNTYDSSYSEGAVIAGNDDYTQYVVKSCTSGDESSSKFNVVATVQKRTDNYVTDTQYYWGNAVPSGYTSKRDPRKVEVTNASEKSTAIEKLGLSTGFGTGTITFTASVTEGESDSSKNAHYKTIEFGDSPIIKNNVGTVRTGLSSLTAGATLTNATPDEVFELKSNIQYEKVLRLLMWVRKELRSK